MSRRVGAFSVVACLLMTVAAGGAQRTVKVSNSWVQAAESTATAGATIENATMYDVYLVGVESDAAGAAELVQITAGKANVTKELQIPAFDRLEMSPTGVHVVLRDLKKPLKTGDSVVISLQTDGGERLLLEATVK